VLLLSRTSAEEAQRICARIGQLCLETKEGAALSIALGCATRTSVEENLADVLREAETRMYQQKISSAESRRSALVLSLQQALAEKSHETEEHARNLQRLAVNLAQRVGLSDGEVVTTSLVALLHDIVSWQFPRPSWTSPAAHGGRVAGDEAPLGDRAPHRVLVPRSAGCGCGSAPPP